MKNLLVVFMLFMLPVFSIAAEIVVTDDITQNTTWTADNVYTLNGLIFVDSLVTLTIEPGTVIKGREKDNITVADGASALIIRRGGKLMAVGTAQAPIIFTSELDDLSISDDLGPTDRQLWGGLILLGRATTNQPDTSKNQIEGIPITENARYGGDDNNDNSGMLRYISIRHGGFSISGIPGDEINGLTMGAVGSGTTIEYIEVYANFDDGFEWFGGTVNTKYLVAAFCGDDGFDYDQGFRGKHQFWFVVQGADIAGRAGEHDGGDDCETCPPYSMPKISNVTYIGSGTTATPEGENNDRCLYFRDNAGGKYYNSIFTDFTGAAIKVEDIDGSDSKERMEQGDLLLKNNLWYAFGAGNTWSDMAESDISNQFLVDSLTANNNPITDPQLRNISRIANNQLDPRPDPGGPAASGAIDLGDPFFTNVDYYGAFDPNTQPWIRYWTALWQESILVSIKELKIAEATIPAEYDLSQNYPNPFNPTTRINYRLPKADNVTLVIYNSLGQKIATLVEGPRAAGEYSVTWNASNLASGVYFYRLETSSTSIIKKMMLMK